MALIYCCDTVRILEASHSKHFPLSLIIITFHKEVYLRFMKSGWCSQITLPLWIFSFTRNKEISFVLSPIVTRFSLLLRQVFSAKIVSVVVKSYLPFLYNQWKFSSYWTKRTLFSQRAYGVIQEKHTNKTSHLGLFLLFNEPQICWAFS